MSNNVVIAEFVPPEPKNRIVSLVMSEEVAETLLLVAGGVSSLGKRRCHTNAIYDALLELGISRSPQERFTGEFRPRVS